MKQIDNILLAEAHTEWAAAVNGAKTFVVDKWAGVFGIEVATLYRKLKHFGYQLPQRKTKCTKGVSKIEGLHDIARTVAHLYALIPKRAGRKPSLEYAVEKALLNGLIPERAKDISVGTIGRTLRELRLLDQKGRCLRFEAKRPMEQIQFDVSGSEYLYVHRFEGKEPILRIRSSKSYKNKYRYEKLRVYYYGIVDDHSRYWLAMPHISEGENSGDAIKTFKWAFSRKADERIPFRGLPSRIYLDNGPLTKAKATTDFLDRLGVELKPHEPESSDDTGKIEVKWKALWSGFEVGEFLMQPHWEKQEISLTQLREMLVNYMVRLNNKRHPNMNVTRTQAWLKVIQDGGVIDVEESAFDTVFNYYDRKLEADGTFSLDNVKYFIKGLINADIRVYVGLSNGRVIAEDILTHKRYEAAPFAMPGLDEQKMDKQLPAVKVREEAQELKKRFAPGEFKSVYTTNPESTTPAFGHPSLDKAGSERKVAFMTVRTKEDRQVESPFSDINTYPNIEEAMKDFMSYMTGEFISIEERGDVAAAIESHGLDRQWVENFALEVRANMSKRVAM